MKNYITFSVAVALSCLCNAEAQELRGDVTVQGDYLPTLRSHTRISPLPNAPRLSLPDAALQISSTGVPTHLDPMLAPMQASGWKSVKDFSRYRGYFVLGGGSYLNFSSSAGYRFIDNEKTTLGAWLQHTSSSGYKPDSNVADVKSVSAKRFDEQLGVYGSHNFGNAGTAGFDLCYHLGYFNYYSTRYVDDGEGTVPPTQTLNDFKAQLWYESLRKDEGFSWNAALSNRYFGYRRAYFVSDRIRPSKENNLQLDAAANYAFGSGMGINLGLMGNYLHYTEPAYLNEESTSLESIVPDNYARLALTPAFNYFSGSFNAHLGARFDFTSNMDHAETEFVRLFDDFANVHVAPDVQLGYRRGKLAAQLSLTGGVELRTLAAGSELFYAQMPQLSTTLPWFSPVNARIGFDFGSFGGLTARVGAAYKITHNILPELLYPICIGNPGGVARGGDFTTLDVKGWSLQAGLGFKYGDVLDVNADLSYQPQSGDSGFFNGADRPRWIIDAKANINPWSTLNINFGYEYRGVRNIWYRFLPATAASPVIPEIISNVRLNDLTDLSIGADYTFMHRYTIWLKTENLLDNHTMLTMDMPSQGFSIMGGIGIVF